MAGTLIASISGIRGIFGSGLDPAAIVRFAGAFGTWCRRGAAGTRPVVVVGRDARITGDVCARLVTATLQSTGVDVIDAGLATTPTVEMAVIAERAAGGVVLSASHNPAEWNALKLLDARGQFLSASDGAAVLALAERDGAEIVAYDGLGSYRENDYLSYHVQRILELDFVDAAAIARRNFKIVVDAVNSVGGIAVPALLTRLGVERITCLHCEPTGRFAHPAEPLPEHLAELSAEVARLDADLGIAVDPDVDRLALVADGGRYLSEELTQVLAADFLWRRRSGPFVTNLSSSRAIDDVAARYGQSVFRSAVGEINVVEKMQEVGAVLGGEGSGGVILPDLHYGRDALVGIAMILQHLASEGKPLSVLREELPSYTISKNKTPIGDLDPDALLRTLAEKFRDHETDTTDGLKVHVPEGWVHMRRSNTEPIIRIYAEAASAEAAQALAERFMREVHAVSSPA